MRFAAASPAARRSAESARMRPCLRGALSIAGWRQTPSRAIKKDGDHPAGVDRRGAYSAASRRVVLGPIRAGVRARVRKSGFPSPPSGRREIAKRCARAKEVSSAIARVLARAKISRGRRRNSAPIRPHGSPWFCTKVRASHAREQAICETIRARPLQNLPADRRRSKRCSAAAKVASKWQTELFTIRSDRRKPLAPSGAL